MGLLCVFLYLMWVFLILNCKYNLVFLKGILSFVLCTVKFQAHLEINRLLWHRDFCTWMGGGRTGFLLWGAKSVMRPCVSQHFVLGTSSYRLTRDEQIEQLGMRPTRDDQQIQCVHYCSTRKFLKCTRDVATHNATEWCDEISNALTLWRRLYV